MKLLVLIAALLLASQCPGQYYGSSSQAYSAASGSMTVVRNPGPSWPGPHGSCMMCLGNHLIGHGYTYDYINSVGYQSWQTLHDNAHNPKLVSKPVAKSQPIYAPTPSAVIERVLAVSDLSDGSVFYDLGSGDGRVVIAAVVKTGCKGYGVDLDREKVNAATREARKQNVADKAKFYVADAKMTDLSEADVVYVYLETATLEELLPRFKEMKLSAKLISYQHQVPGLVLQKVYDVEGDKIFVWGYVSRSVFGGK